MRLLSCIRCLYPFGNLLIQIAVTQAENMIWGGVDLHVGTAILLRFLLIRLEKAGRPSLQSLTLDMQGLPANSPLFCFIFFSLALLKKMAFHTDSYNWSWVSILSSLVLIKQLNPDWLPCGGLCLTSCVRSGETNRRINILFLRQCGMLDPQTIPITLSPSAKMDQRNDLISIRRWRLTVTDTVLRCWDALWEAFQRSEDFRMSFPVEKLMFALWSLNPIKQLFLSSLGFIQDAPLTLKSRLSGVWTFWRTATATSACSVFSFLFPERSVLAELTGRESRDWFITWCVCACACDMHTWIQTHT